MNDQRDIERAEGEGMVSAAAQTPPAAVKPCPFCGAPGDVRQMEARDFGWQATCSSGDCEISPGAYCFKTREEAIELWNKRA